MDHSLPGSCPWGFLSNNTGAGYHFFSRWSSWPRDQTLVSSLAGRFFTTESPGKPLYKRMNVGYRQTLSHFIWQTWASTDCGMGGWVRVSWTQFPCKYWEQLYHIEASSREEVNFNHHCQKHNLLLLSLRLSHVLLFCNPRDCSLPGSSVHGISQARILEWVAISFSRDLPSPGIKPMSPALAGRFFATEPPGKPLIQQTLY